MKKRIPLIGILLFLFGTGLAFAQTGTITGTVTDNTGETLPGVNVIVQLEARTIGASTDVDGRYTINNVPAGTRTVVARFVGFSTQTQQVQVGSGETVTVDFELGQSTLNLGELVVTGTGAAVERQSVGHSISSVDFGGIEDAGVSNLQDAMSGKIAGVNIQGGGTVDQEPRIRIRGTSSISMTNQPLVYVDGVRVQSSGGFAPGVGGGSIGDPSALANINFDAIKRIEVLKGPAAATLYGSQANAGVIQIFTNQGTQETAPQIDVELTNTFIQMPDMWNKMTGIVETQEEQDRVAQFTGVTHDFYEPFVGEYQMIDLYDVGSGQEISTSVQGGGEGMTYYANLRYSRTDGPFNPQPSDFNGGAVGDGNDLSKRLYFSGNLNIIPTEDFRVRLQTSYTNTNYSTYNTGISIYSVTNSYGKPERIGTWTEHDTFGHPFASTPREGSYYEIGDVSDSGRFVLKADYLVSEEVSLDASFGIDYRDQRSSRLAPFGYAVDGRAPTPDGALDLGSRQQLTWSFESKVNWTSDFTEDIRSTFVAGAQGYATETNSQSASGTAFSGPGLEVMDATAT